MRKQTTLRAAAQASAPLASGYWTGAHTLHRLRLHLVWVPKYRRRVLGEPVATRLTQLLRQACEVNGWGLHELSVQEDHVHLLLQISPSESAASVMQSLKGGTARVLRAEFPDLEEFLWGESFWGDGYFAETVGQAEEAIVRAYIRNPHLPKSNPHLPKSNPHLPKSNPHLPKSNPHLPKSNPHLPKRPRQKKPRPVR